MTVVGVTGHQHLSPQVASYAQARIRDELSERAPVIGVTSLADGADQLFAKLVLSIGGTIVAVIPAADYEDSYASIAARHAYRSLLESSAQIVRLPFEKSSEAAYWAAGKEIVNRADVVLAVWDGEPSRGLGGTADVVSYAREKGRDVVIIWPEGVTRD